MVDVYQQEFCGMSEQKFVELATLIAGGSLVDDDVMNSNTMFAVVAREAIENGYHWIPYGSFVRTADASYYFGNRESDADISVSARPSEFYFYDVQSASWKFDKQRYISDYLMPTIDMNTRDLVDRGFIFAGRTFSLSLPAQSNWIALHTEVLDGKYPEAGETFSTKDDYLYTLMPSDVSAFFDAAMSTARGWITAGSIEKQKVRGMNTQAELESYVDPRII